MKILMIGFAIFISMALYAQAEKNFIDQNYIEVTGHSEMEVAPNEIYMKILVNEKDVKGQTLAQTEKNMIAGLQAIGIDITKDLAIQDESSNFKNYWILKTNIVLSKEYQLQVRDAKTAGKVIMELQKLGISNVSIDHVDNNKIEDFRKEVKIKAIQAAQEKAMALSEAIHQTIGKAIYIQELNDNPLTLMQEKTRGMTIRGISTADNETIEPDIEFNKIKLAYSILVRFELK
jgi:uncharacterized protein YggE